MSRARQVAVVAAVAGTLLLATSSAAARRPAGPYLCFANHPCPGLTASICFASAVVREPACPPPQVTYRFAQSQPQPPQGERP